MLAVPEEHRGKGIATKLVRRAVDAMIAKDADEVSSLLPEPVEKTHGFPDCSRN